MGNAYLSLITLSVTSIVGLFLQVGETPVALFNQLERGGIVVISLTAIWILWRALQKKDTDNMALTKLMAEALIANTDSQKELRKIVEESIRAKEGLKVAIDLLTKAVDGCPTHDEAFVKKVR